MGDTDGFVNPTTSSRDVVIGNVYDKYATRNPVARWLVGGFMRAVEELYRRVSPRTVLEVGCGEGLLASRLIRCGPGPDWFHASDISLQKLSEKVDPGISFLEASAYDLPYQDDTFDLVLCCEVLEHLDSPRRALDEMARVARRAVILSTPWEPVWRIANVARGRYLSRLGNTPGHVQHFGRRDLVRLVSNDFRVVDMRRPFPWTMLLGEPLS